MQYYFNELLLIINLFFFIKLIKVNKYIKLLVLFLLYKLFNKIFYFSNKLKSFS